MTESAPSTTREKISMLAYQEQIFSRLAEGRTAEKENVIHVTVNGAARRINGNDISSVEIAGTHSTAPNVYPWVFGLSNIRSKPTILLDLDAWISGKDSKFRSERIPSGFSCLLVKGHDIAIVCKIIGESSDSPFIDLSSIKSGNLGSPQGDSK